MHNKIVLKMEGILETLFQTPRIIYERRWSKTIKKLNQGHSRLKPSLVIFNSIS